MRHVQEDGPVPVAKVGRADGVGGAVLPWPGAGWLHLPEGPLAGVAVPQWSLAARSWQRLPPDEYLADGGRYRQRRYSRFHLAGGRLELLAHAPFFQSLAFNPVNGGQARLFAPLEPGFAASSALRELVFALVEMLPRAEWACGVHQIRTLADGGPGRPSPEGIHQDGHHFVAQVMVARTGVEGGRSVVYNGQRRPLHAVTLTRALETLVVDDRRVFHDVSDIHPAGDGPGHRDMLLVDFVPASS
jgi:hypothetical protein